MPEEKPPLYNGPFEILRESVDESYEVSRSVIAWAATYHIAVLICKAMNTLYSEGSYKYYFQAPQDHELQ